MKTEQDTAKEVVSLLDESTASLDRETLDRLYAARMKAVANLAERRQTAITTETEGFGQVIRMLGSYAHQHRIVMPAVMICGAAFVAFMLTQQIAGHSAVEQGDAFLLGAELPPEAFLDKGFDTWVARTSQQ